MNILQPMELSKYGFHCIRDLMKWLIYPWVANIWVFFLYYFHPVTTVESWNGIIPYVIRVWNLSSGH